jgi:hypothetical protein
MVTCTGGARVAGGQMEIDGQWLTYADAAVQLGVTAEAARRRAIRGKWARLPLLSLLRVQLFLEFFDGSLPLRFLVLCRLGGRSGVRGWWTSFVNKVA